MKLRSFACYACALACVVATACEDSEDTNHSPGASGAAGVGASGGSAGSAASGGNSGNGGAANGGSSAGGDAEGGEGLGGEGGGGEAGASGLGGTAGTGGGAGSGASAGASGTGGVAGTGATGGAGALGGAGAAGGGAGAGFSGGGNAGAAGNGGISGSAGAAGNGGISGNAGTGVNGGISGSGGASGGASGAAGTGGLGGNGGSGVTGGAGGGGMAAGAGGAAATGGAGATGGSGSSIPCPINAPAFCETFGAAAPGGRAGDLDETRWSASRLSLLVDTATGPYDGWFPTQVSDCNGAPLTLQADSDLVVCGSGSRRGLHDALHYDTSFNSEVNRTLMVRQPIDFTDQAAVIAFELASANPLEIVDVWVTREPLTGLGQSVTFPMGALRVRLSSFNCSGNRARFSAEIGTDGVIIPLTPQGDNSCVDTGNDALVHYELRISRDLLDVYVTAPGAPEVRATAFSRPLPGTLGNKAYLHLVHSRVTLDDGTPMTREVRWGSVAFDGPVLNAGRNYDVADSLTPATGAAIPAGYVNIGYRLGSSVFTVDGVDLTGQAVAMLLFNVYGLTPGSTPPQVRFNGGQSRPVYAQSIPPSAPWRAMSLSVPVTDLVSGRNTIEFQAPVPMIVANVSLHLEPGMDR